MNQFELNSETTAHCLMHQRERASYASFELGLENCIAREREWVRASKWVSGEKIYNTQQMWKRKKNAPYNKYANFTPIFAHENEHTQNTHSQKINW